MTTPLLCLAIAIYFEAGIEPLAGKFAVAEVIVNRVESTQYPNTICKVVNQQKGGVCQFSFYCDGKPERPYPGKQWLLSKWVAEETLKGKAPSLLNHNTIHYHATYVAPRWAEQFSSRRVIGNHIFLGD